METTGVSGQDPVEEFNIYLNFHGTITCNIESAKIKNKKYVEFETHGLNNSLIAGANMAKEEITKAGYDVDFSPDKDRNCIDWIISW